MIVGQISEFKRYAKVLQESKHVTIYWYPKRSDAELKRKRLRKYSAKHIVRARDEKGKFVKGFVLICCK